MLWKCVTASTIQKFDKRMEEMKNHNLEAYEWLRKIPPQHWARSHFTASRWKVPSLVITGLESKGIPYEEKFECSEDARQVRWTLTHQVLQRPLMLIVRVCQLLGKGKLSGIPCTHAVASIWDQANNGIDTGIPESYCLPVHWLTTWKEMLDTIQEVMQSKKRGGITTSCCCYWVIGDAAHVHNKLVHGSQTQSEYTTS
ncbi:hypothetical protein Tco_0262203 [Tanacetum coccineum]